MMVMPIPIAKSSSNVSSLWFYVIFFGGLIGLRKWRAYQASKVVIQSSLLILLHVPGAGLTKISDGTLGGYPYDIMIADSGGGKNTSPVLVNATKHGGAVILTLTLPFASHVHLAGLGIPKDDELQNLAASVGLEPAVLEGDFPDYFQVFCGTDQQIDLREVIDPADMAFLADYCKRENWEVLGNTIYFSQNTDAPDDDPNIDNTTMVKDAEDFTKRVVPILQRMNTSL